MQTPSDASTEKTSAKRFLSYAFSLRVLPLVPEKKSARKTRPRGCRCRVLSVYAVGAQERTNLGEVQGDDAGTAAHPTEVERSSIRAHVVLVAHHRAQRRRRGEEAGRTIGIYMTEQNSTGQQAIEEVGMGA